MRGIIGLVLAGLGAFLIALAVLLPAWVVGQVLKFPLSESETATLEASNATYFSVSALRERTGVTLEATYTITGDAAAGSSSTAVSELPAAASPVIVYVARRVTPVRSRRADTLK